MLIREFLKDNGISKTALTDIKFQGGSILVNGDSKTVRYELVEGDRLTVIFPKEMPSEGIIPQDILLDIIYEDDFLLVINKPPYMSSIPSREHQTGSLANALLFYYEKIGLQATVHLINRLDRDTSGLLAVAKHRHVHHLFSEQQKSGVLTRAYQAIVHGSMKENQGTIDAPIGRKENSIIEREVRDDGKYAITHYSVLSRHTNITHVSLHLETGRTHQIRVHLSYLGHPIVGDSLYRGSKELINRQALHCSELSFFHPFYEKEMVFRSELPTDMGMVLHNPESS